MRYYEQRYPEVDELVMVQVRQIAEMGAYVKLVRPLVYIPSVEGRSHSDLERSWNMTTLRE